MGQRFACCYAQFQINHQLQWLLNLDVFAVHLERIPTLLFVCFSFFFFFFFFFLFYFFFFFFFLLLVTDYIFFCYGRLHIVGTLGGKFECLSQSSGFGGD